MGHEATMRLGFIGTGLLGAAMVRRLLDLGHQVTIWNRAPERLVPLVELGAVAAASPRDVAEASDVVMLCVLNTEAVRDCVSGPEGTAAASSRPRLFIDFSTIDPEATREIARSLASSNSHWVDAPVSGGPDAALDGRLAIMVGATQEGYAAAQPVLAHFGSNVTLMGPVGAGQTTKMINQAIVGAGFVMMAEALTLARVAGIDAKKLPACLKGGYADSPLLQAIYPRMVDAAFDPPAAFARQLLKDLVAVRDFARSEGATLPLVEAATQRYETYVGQGHGMAESASILRLYEEELRR